jgi:hypothetical protein
MVSRTNAGANGGASPFIINQMKAADRLDLSQGKSMVTVRILDIEIDR